jgi:mutator protein MutT
VELTGWDERYRSARQVHWAPTPLLAETAAKLKPGRALDLACGVGRNAAWLAERGWTVTAVDGSPAAIEILRGHCPAVDAHVADLEKGEFAVGESRWDLIAICYYLQPDLIEAAKRGVVPGGVALVIVHITEPGEEPTKYRLRPGELARFFTGWEILHSHEGAPNDPEHRRLSAEIVARRPAAVVAAVIERNGRILIAQRQRGGRHPLKWEFPGGKAEPGEDPRAALARELREELGVEARVGELLDSYHVRYPGAPAIELMFYRAAIQAGEPRNLVFERIAWERPERLPDYDFLEGDASFVARLAAPPESPENP